MKLNLDSYEMTHKDIKFNDKFINRELSWLDFNYRVLDCANNPSIPINERLNFLGITTSNLDEFLSVRFSYAYYNKDKEQYKDILKSIYKFLNNQIKSYNNLQLDLKKEDISISKVSKLDKKELKKLNNIFNLSIFPLLSPTNIKSNNDIPNMNNGDLCIGCLSGDNDLIIIPIPKSINYLIKVNKKYLLIEDVVLSLLDDILINKNIKHKCVFRLIKDMSFTLDHDNSKFIIDRMNDIILQRQSSKPIFCEFESSVDSNLKDLIIDTFDINKSHIFYSKQIVDYRRFMKNKLLSSNYSYKPFKSHNLKFNDSKYSIFSIIDEKDILLQHPYDSYESVVRFINHAAIDKDVVAIRQTLYRVSSIDGPIINGLCKAAKNGKQVTVLVEIKARFDEKNNIEIIEKLKESGCNVLLGNEYLKTHCKMCLVISKDNDTYKIYSHVATGNYNEKTSMLYTDISYFTSKQKIGNDLLHIFNILSGVSKPDSKLQKISYSPVTLRKTIISNIDKCIKLAKKDKKSEIFIKVNSISDKIIVKKLYEAADSGVNIYIICRGICSIIPRKNLYIKSIVGRFLEHSRIYHFNYDGNKEYYISSADLLTRNLDRRIEILLNISDNKCINKLQEIIKVMKKDEVNSFIMDTKGNFSRGKGNYNCHSEFIENKIK